MTAARAKVLCYPIGAVPAGAGYYGRCHCLWQSTTCASSVESAMGYVLSEHGWTPASDGCAICGRVLYVPVPAYVAYRPATQLDPVTSQRTEVWVCQDVIGCQFRAREQAEALGNFDQELVDLLAGAGGDG